MSNRRCQVILALGAFLFLIAGAVPLSASPGDETDARLFAGELQSGGAFKFAEDTEDELRSGKFELAFARYLFLKSHIRGSSLYLALNAMVDQRLHFLKSQMGLEEIPAYTAPYRKLKPRVRKEAAPVTPAKAEAADRKSLASKAEDSEQPEEPASLPAPAAQAPSPPPEEEVQEEKAEEKKPAPPPSTWERLKRRLKFW